MKPGGAKFSLSPVFAGTSQNHTSASLKSQRMEKLRQHKSVSTVARNGRTAQNTKKTCPTPQRREIKLKLTPQDKKPDSPTCNNLIVTAFLLSAKQQYSHDRRYCAMKASLSDEYTVPQRRRMPVVSPAAPNVAVFKPIVNPLSLAPRIRLCYQHP